MTFDSPPGLVPATALLTIAEAAALSGLSTDTIKNDRAAGHYPGARLSPARLKQLIAGPTTRVDVAEVWSILSPSTGIAADAR